MTERQHIVKQFQRWTKAEQAEHLLLVHGVRVSIDRVAGSRTGFNPIYHRHIDAHDDEAGR